MASKSFINYVRASKLRLILSTIAVGLGLGLFLTIMNLSSNIGVIPNFIFNSIAMMYIFYILIAGYAGRINSTIIQKTNYRKILNFRIFGIWGISIMGWIFSGLLLLLIYPSALVVWLYILIGLFTVYPCIVSLAVYLPSFQYLKQISTELTEKKTIVKSLTLATVGLATPWILALFFVFAFVTLPFWVDYIVVLACYLSIFFLAIDLPYYQSMEEIKKKKVDGLKAIRDKLIEKLCNISETNQRLAIEVNIDRIDRDIENIKSEQSHPYLFLKPIAAFLVVSILANLLVEILKVALTMG